MQFSQYRLVINQTWFDATLVYKSLSAQCPKMRWKFVEPFEFNRALQFTVERETFIVHLTTMLCHLKSAQVTAKQCLSCYHG